MGWNNEAWLRHLTGDEAQKHEALRELRGALLRGLRGALASYSGVDDAFLEDAVQDSLLRVLDRLSQFEGRSRFVTWATSIAIRVALSELRRRRWKDVSLDALTADAETPNLEGSRTEPRQTSRLARKGLVETMHEVIGRELTDKQRTVLQAELKGMPQDEIARRLGSNRNAIYKLAHDARKRLKRGLEAAGYQADDVHAAFVT